MHNLSSLGLLVAMGSQAVTALTYVIDSSCGDTLGPVIAETTQMARLSLEKLGSEDEAMKAALSQIFKTTDAAFLKSMTPTVDFEQSDIRIYCDDDEADETPGGTSKRWQLEPDKKIPKRKKGKELVNSKKPFKEQTYWDPKNQLYRGKESRGCKDGDTSAQTYRVLDKATIESTQNPNRVTITICDDTLAQLIKVLSDVTGDKDLTVDNLRMEVFQDLLSVTLFHELCHIGTVLGVPGHGASEPVGWEMIVPLSDVEAKNAADAYAFLGLLALLSDRNVRLSTDPGKSEIGVLQWIKEPEPLEPLTRKRERAIWFSS